MKKGTVDFIEQWDSSPFTDGYADLSVLSDREFSGTVATRDTWLFMLNGRIIGIFGGELDAFETAEGTVHTAPHPGLVLLFAMQESTGETEAKYYTNDTPLSEVDQTLSDSGFTGYIELSENVLSGDYYIVYYGGKSMSVAFVGNSKRVLTDDEAFEQATDEVGIYEVRSVDLSVREVPATEPQSPTSDASGVNDDDDASDETSEPTQNEPEDSVDDSSSSLVDESSVIELEDGSATDFDPSPVTEAEPGTSTTTQPAADATADPTGPKSSSPSPDTREESPPPSTESIEENRPPDTPPSSDRQSAKGDDDQDRFSEEEAWRKTRTIPALDPEETDTESSSPAQADDQPSRHPDQPVQQTQVSPPEPQEEPPSEPPASSQPEEDAETTELESKIESQRSEINELRERVESVVAERNELESKLTDQRSTPSTTESSSEIDRTDALSQTDLFVRYGSKGAATLQDAHDNAVSKDEVTENLQLETHTRFSSDDVTVGGRSFAAFLRDRIEYRFVEWVTNDLLYEIRDTGNQGHLKELYDALPKIDRAELYGVVISRDEEGEEHRRSFDIILRDRMGQPLVVANVNEARDPAGSEMMSELAESATEMAENHDQLGAAFLVTSSFFSPDALETAADATSGGFLSRDKRKSFVKLSRKRGYHLCLIEARDDSFHIAVPEL